MADCQWPHYPRNESRLTAYTPDAHHVSHYSPFYPSSPATYVTPLSSAYHFAHNPWYTPYGSQISSSSVPFRTHQTHTPELNPFCRTIQPQMIYRYSAPPVPSLIDSSALQDNLDYVPCLKFESESSVSSPTVSSVGNYPRYHFNQPWRSLSMHDQDFRHPVSPPSTSSEEEDDEDEGEEEQKASTYDEPYAQLIYKVLMQAPGHRMVLQDIYSWFQRNTLKPVGSTTGGWQNSIRHNLSMNRVSTKKKCLFDSTNVKKAFQNVKNGSEPACGQGKASSVWGLTEDAIKHGVQSTTRYRKTGTSRKNCGRSPALQRQKSGAKGGIAARHSARLRHLRRRPDPAYCASAGHSSASTPVMLESSPQITGAVNEWSRHSYSPNSHEQPFTPSYNPFLPTPYHHAHALDPKLGTDISCYDEDSQAAHFLTQLSQGEGYGRMA